MPISVQGTQITFNDSTNQTTAFTGAVTSVATGNGLTGGPITTTGTLSIAAPSYQSVGSYCYLYTTVGNTNIFANSNYSGTNALITSGDTGLSTSGTWRALGNDTGGLNYLGVRVA